MSAHASCSNLGAGLIVRPFLDSMAKTRLQAKYPDDDEEASVGTPAVKPSVALPRQKKKERYSGALDVLRQEYKENGLAGWYQVRLSYSTCARLSEADVPAPPTGNASANHEGRPLASPAVRHQGCARGLYVRCQSLFALDADPALTAADAVLSLIYYSKLRGAEVGIKKL